MTQKNKLNVGALPEQIDDYSRFEESGLRWDRIALAGLAVIAIVAMLYALFSGEATKQASSSKAITETNPTATIAPPPLSTEHQLTPELTVTENVAHQEQQAPLIKVEQPVVESVTETRLQEKNTPNQSPIKITNSGITQAQLSANLNEAKAVSILGHEISMAGQNVIKVVLTTEMSGLRNRVLYHDWYRENQRQARVKIPVNVSPQSSSSSKYINQQMLGRWQVKVVDAQEVLYLQADFDVVGE